ncbi:hypothetical protein CAOG_05085 [Capsaspora owczarzaki ATCC 30864]|uniref:hypothetical protein n=1 Tax=Capsaspora owczarzaki (strain ATCC 30864) TaxID=595528 RepID=UPI0003522714|nr:hypothetical protein CAOG_05085 [Capsaspora owczarzaki ATCC 30864]|eukprot:XP_004346770.2 hypothetical protein CAOG_05085 [Capsaspora owczarzaki ATCC 30864]
MEERLPEEEIGDAGAKAIAEALKVNATVTTLERTIAETLKVNTTLTQLLNQIREGGMNAIAEALKVNTSVTALGLGINQIGDAGAQAIAETLKVNTTVTRLYLDQNQIGEAGAQAIAETLKVNKTLSELYLGDNRISDAGATPIAEALKVNTTLTALDLGKNQIGNLGMMAIAEALKVNTSLTEHNLNVNQIGDEGAKAIAEALKVNTSVKKLNLAFNCIGKVAAQAIQDARPLTELKLNYQINPLAFALRPRLATAEDLQIVFRMLTSGLELENQSASLPALPAEIADLIMDEAYYWQGVERVNWIEGTADGVLKVTVPQSINGNSIRVKVIQVLWDKSTEGKSKQNCVFYLTIRDEQGVVRYECAATPSFVDSTIRLATIWPASHPVIRQMREGWEVQVQPSEPPGDDVLEYLYVGYV